MAAKGENVRALIVDEFVDDAKLSPSHAQDDRTDRDCVRDLVHRIANEMGVTQYQTNEIVDRVLAANGPSIEDNVRHELQKQKQSRPGKQNESKAG